MAMHLVHELPSVMDHDGNVYAARVVGAPAKDGLWDGAIELRDQYGERMVTPVETRQPNLADLVYWSTGLTPVYVEGALARALAAAAASAAASGDRAVEVLERNLRFRRPPRPATTARRASPGRWASSGKRPAARPRRAKAAPARSR